MDFDTGDGDLSTMDLIETSYPILGCDDTIKGNDGNDILIGGFANDKIYGHVGVDVIIGDGGRVILEGGVIAFLETIDPADGGDDIIEGNEQDDILIGGYCKDDITGHDGNDLVIGDNGFVDFGIFDGDLSTIDLIETTDPLLGCDDIIEGNDGNDIMIGGFANDKIYGHIGVDVIIGDGGRVILEGGVIAFLETIHPADGGDDTIEGNDGDDILIGGYCYDTITAHEGDDVVLGDNGFMDFGIFDGDLSTIDLIETTYPNLGCDDTIEGNDGDDILIGGAADDTISGNASDDVIIGDGARITLIDRDILYIQTIDPADGGNDTIDGNEHDDLILGGFGMDNISGNGGNDFIIGDNGFFDFMVNDSDPATLDVASSTDPNLGGKDTISGGDGKDIIFGGTDDDTISGGSGHDIILGDHGLVDYSLTTNQFYVSIYTSELDGAGNDTINGDAGDDFILGQQGNDRLFGDSGEDDITGGHNVLFGADGDDYMSGGTEADVMLGDNGLIERRIIGNASLTDGLWERYPVPFDDVIRDVQRFDDVDFVGGDDIMYGDEGDDIIHGQRGDDELHGGPGTDELFGEIGNDTISGNDGPDIIIGDVGYILRAYNEDGTPRVNKNGAWHRDVSLEEVAFIKGVINIDTTPLKDMPDDLAKHLLLADLLILTGAFKSDGTKLTFEKGIGSWVISSLTLSYSGGEDADITVKYGEVEDNGDGTYTITPKEGKEKLESKTKIYIDGILNTEIHTSGSQPLDVDDIYGDFTIVAIDKIWSDYISCWDTNLWFLDLVEANHDTLDGGEGEDVLFGQRGNDILAGGDDNDIIFSDGVLNVVSFFTDIPHVFNDIRLIGIEDGADIPVTLELFGSVIIPPITLYPEELHLVTPFILSLPLVTALHETALNFADFLGSEALTRTTDGAAIVPYISIVPDIANHLGMLSGNDEIDGGNGDDIIFGDNTKIYSEILTGLKEIEEAQDDVWVAFNYVMEGFHNLALDYDYFVHEVLGEEHGQDLEIGNDTITGSEGNDIIVGDDCSFIGAFIKGIPVEEDNFKEQALEIYAYLRDLEYMAINLDYVIFEAHHALVDELIDDAIEKNPDKKPPKKNDRVNPHYHDLYIGNDDISGGDGVDMIIGDSGTLFTPLIDGVRFKDIKEYQDIDKDIWKDTEKALDDQDKYRDWLLKKHEKYCHNLDEHKHDNKDLELLVWDYEYDLFAGNDIIDAGDGNDLVLGDFCVLAVPVVLKFPHGDIEYEGIKSLTLLYSGGAGADITVDHGVVKDNGDGTYTITPEDGKEKLKSNTKIYIDGIEYVKIHTSCSKPLDVGDVYGLFTVDDVDKIWDSDKAYKELEKDIKDLLKDIEYFVKDQYERLFKHKYHNKGHADYSDRGGKYQKNIANAGNDIIIGGLGEDFIMGDSTSIFAIYMAENGQLFSNSKENFEIHSQARKYHLIEDPYHQYDKDESTLENDIIEGNVGDDIIFGQFGDDDINGGDGDDALFGGKGKNDVDGGDGDDIVKKNGDYKPNSYYREILEEYIFSILTP